MEGNEHSSFTDQAEKTEEPSVSENAETRPLQAEVMEPSEAAKKVSPAEEAAKRREAFRSEYAAGVSQEQADQPEGVRSPQQTYDCGNQPYGQPDGGRACDDRSYRDGSRMDNGAYQSYVNQPYQGESYSSQYQADANWQNYAARDPQEAYHRQMPAGQGGGNPETLGMIGMICGIISIPAAFSVFLGLILGIIGIVCSATARRRGEQSGTTTAGLVTGIIGVVLSLIILLIFVILVLGFARGASYYYYGY